MTKELNSKLSWRCGTYEDLDAKDAADSARALEPRPELTPQQQAYRRVIVELIRYGRKRLCRSIN